MKKNAMLKIAAVLLVAVLLTTCAISSTFAKYASEGGSFTDGARVAKWGVTVTTKLDASQSGFKTEYKDGNKWVKTRESDNVVAPGTSGVLKLAMNVVIENAEVSGEVQVLDKDGNKTYLTDGTNGRIKFYLEDPATNPSAVAKTADDINTELAKLNVPFNPTSDKIEMKDINIYWVWPFDGGNDSADTALGEDGEALVEFSINMDIVQTGPAVLGAN